MSGGWSPSDNNAARHFAQQARLAAAEGLARFREQQAVPVQRKAGVRLLLTGSRDWTDWELLGAKLAEWRPAVVVHGGCYPRIDPETGRRPWVSADWLGHLWCRRNGVPDEPWPADWRTHGRGAGPLRNAAMVHAGADVCLAFILNRSAGASGCAELAEKAGIPTHRFTATTDRSERMAP